MVPVWLCTSTLAPSSLMASSPNQTAETCSSSYPLDSIENDVELQRKTTRLCEHSEVDECLYKCFIQKRSERAPINGVIIKAQAVQFNKLLGGD
jgi:hypothetical protein